jgi:ADP-ribose pyrophosphatase YjhB (NUDIX family)
MRIAINTLIIEDNSVLLVRKKLTWILPGGKPSQGEDDIACLCREISEELSGTRLKDFKYYADFEGKTPHQGDILKARVYFAKIDGQLNPISAEIKEKKFVPNKDMDSYKLSDITSKIINSLRNDKYII